MNELRRDIQKKAGIILAEEGGEVLTPIMMAIIKNLLEAKKYLIEAYNIPYSNFKMGNGLKESDDKEEIDIEAANNLLKVFIDKLNKVRSSLPKLKDEIKKYNPPNFQNKEYVESFYKEIKAGNPSMNKMARSVIQGVVNGLKEYNEVTKEIVDFIEKDFNSKALPKDKI
jgi:hypothetical protein